MKPRLIILILAFLIPACRFIHRPADLWSDDINVDIPIFPPSSAWNTDLNRPPMGLRVRLKADFDITTFSTANQVILFAMKKYGMIVADNGSDWYVSGAPDLRWDDDDLHELVSVTGENFEAVYTGDPETFPP